MPTIKQKERRKNRKAKRRLETLRVNEISFVDRPAVPEATFLVVKRDEEKSEDMSEDNVQTEKGEKMSEQIAEKGDDKEKQFPPEDKEKADNPFAEEDDKEKADNPFTEGDDKEKADGEEMDQEEKPLFRKETRKALSTAIKSLSGVFKGLGEDSVIALRMLMKAAEDDFGDPGLGMDDGEGDPEKAAAHLLSKIDKTLEGIAKNKLVLPLGNEVTKNDETDPQAIILTLDLVEKRSSSRVISKASFGKIDQAHMLLGEVIKSSGFVAKNDDSQPSDTPETIETVNKSQGEEIEPETQTEEAVEKTDLEIAEELFQERQRDREKKRREMEVAKKQREELAAVEALNQVANKLDSLSESLDKTQEKIAIATGELLT